MAQIIDFSFFRPSCRHSLPEDASRTAIPDGGETLRAAIAEIVRTQPDALAPLLAVAFADATADLPKAVADRLARESAVTLLLLLNRLRAALT